jgi:cytochrome c-type biogenesis protein CcsB
MLKLSQFTLVASVMLVSVALICYVVVQTVARSIRRQPVAVNAGGRAGGGEASTSEVVTTNPHTLAKYGTHFTRLALLFLTASLTFRWILVGHGPFSNQYEFAVAFGWGILVAYVYFEHKYHLRSLALVVLPICAALLFYAMSVGDTVSPLMPALQQSLLLSVHVFVAILAYGALAVACAAGLLYLIQPENGRWGLPKPALLDDIGYRAVIIAFPLLTLVIVLGAIWAQIAWGSYWTWDPKETASLLTWLVYGAYLHARVAYGWRGRRASWLLMLGFAAVLFTFFGNLFFGGLHSYAG